MEKDQLLYLIHPVLNEFMAQSLLERQFKTLKINVVWLNEFIYLHEKSDVWTCHNIKTYDYVRFCSGCISICFGISSH